MKISNKERWESWVKSNKDDPYGNAVVECAERWADLMEAEMDKGK